MISRNKLIAAGISLAAITALSVPALMVSAQTDNVQKQSGMEQQINWEESDFEEIQSHILERLDSQIGNLQEHRNEVAAAQSKDDLLNIKKENMKERLNELSINIDGASSPEELRQIQKQNFHGAKKGLKQGIKEAREWRRQNGPIFNSES
ncbi:hypothetical protein GF340_00970 [Candidatus Peregrinibacteria bacterium]|nr:hypothetical protein [Candidatus Peregrinibacteria bacterium]